MTGRTFQPLAEEQGTATLKISALILALTLPSPIRWERAIRWERGALLDERRMDERVHGGGCDCQPGLLPESGGDFAAVGQSANEGKFVRFCPNAAAGFVLEIDDGPCLLRTRRFDLRDG